MFTGIVEELGAVEALEDQGDAVRLTVRGAARHRRRRARGLDLRQRLLPDRRRARRRDVHRRRDARDPRQDLARRAGARRPGSTSSAPSPPTTRLGGHIVQGHVDGTGTVVRREPSRALGGRRDLAAGRRSRATSSTRARSPSTASP